MKVIIKPGHIRIGIDRVVYFEYYLLEKPDRNSEKYFDYATPELSAEWINEMEKYEASKQLVEVSNVCCDIWLPKLYFISKYGTKHTVKNNMPCKAEVTGDKAKIIELIR